MNNAQITHAAQEARRASATLASLSTAKKNALLLDLAGRIALRQDEVLDANAKDVAAANAAGLAPAKLKRLTLSAPGLEQMCDGLRQVAALPDPVGEVTRDRVVPSGLRVRRVRCPLGVIAMIYEARPAVTIDAFALCFKSGNACVLKGGKEAAACGAALAGIAHETLRAHSLPEAALVALSDLSRDGLAHLLTLDTTIDLVIPRGGSELIQFVREHSRIPTVQHYKGVCHIYVDADADLDIAERVCVTAKISAPAACNAAECVLVDAAIAPAAVPRLVAALQRAGVEVRGDDAVRALAPGVVEATPDDWGREYLDTILAMRVVNGIDGAIAHIARYGSNHTEAIITKNAALAGRFMSEVQSSCVVVNASTRFNDGFQLGLGAEIGISTSKIHAYGPMGLEELTTQRYIVQGDGQTR